MAESQDIIQKDILHRVNTGIDESSFNLLTPELCPSHIPPVVRCYASSKEKNKGNITPLLAAIIAKKEEMCKCLIEEGADVNSGCHDGMRPLHAALRFKQYEIAELLITSGADVHVPDQKGRVPMYHAIDKDSPVTIVKAILSAGFPKDGIVRCNYKTKPRPITRAICVKNEPIVKFLLEQNVDINSECSEGITPLNVAICNFSTEIVRLLVNQGANVEGTESIHAPHPLYLAAQQDDNTILKILIDAGANVNKVFTPDTYPKCTLDVSPITAVQLTAILCNLEGTKLLLKHGANVNIKDPLIKDTVLHTLFTIKPKSLTKKQRKDHQKIIQCILESGADINAKNRPGHLPVYNIISSKNWIALQEYIKFVRNVNEPINKREGSIFRLVVSNNEMWLVELCFEYGADCFHKFNGDPVYNVTVKSDNPGMMQLFWKHNYPFDNLPSDKLLKNSPKVSSLLKTQCLLMESIANKDPETVKKTLHQGASINCCSRDGLTPLHISSSSGDSEVVKIVLENGAKTSTLNDAGYSALHQAASHGHLEVCKLLLRHGACLDHRGPDGYTPRQVAELAERTEVVTLLQRASTFFSLLKKKNMKIVDEIEILGSEEFYVYMNCINGRGNTLLIEALRLGLTDIGEKLMSLRLRHDLNWQLKKK